MSVPVGNGSTSQNTVVVDIEIQPQRRINNELVYMGLIYATYSLTEFPLTSHEIPRAFYDSRDRFAMIHFFNRKNAQGYISLPRFIDH